ncbi:hypothetical protein SETIT_1G233700v2 [Setaria italica]|uniref:Uncharacterized protein n=1 Tax=Setaria italica TaxID=4555 RepID=A0A368PQM7_SETIT|nr:hypothetical protein SETIT_1G233700v2 [Setaria italica]
MSYVSCIVAPLPRPIGVHFPTPGIIMPKGDRSNGIVPNIVINSIIWLKQVVAELGGTIPRVQANVVGPLKRPHLFSNTHSRSTNRTREAQADGCN